jgi:hypothetical protein
MRPAVGGGNTTGPSTKEQNMKHFLIKYRFTNGTQEQWHQDIKDFIAALQNDADLKGRISYRCMKVRDDLAYYHLASAVDDQAIKSLQEREFFKRYTDKTKSVAGGKVEVVPLEMIDETKHGA